MASLESSMEAHLQLYEIFISTAKPMALQAAVLLNIPDIIATHGSENHITVEEIASHISASTKKPTHVGHLSRIMRLLASIAVFTEEKTVEDRGAPKFKYGPTALTKLLANNEPGESGAPTLLFLNLKSMTDAYQHLRDSVIDGSQPFTKAHGMNIFEYNSCNPEANRFFNEAMTAHTSSVIASVLEVYDGFKRFKSVVDVGGGAGFAISRIVNEYPHIHGINFDLPHVIRTAAPSKEDFAFCILHDWDDEHCLQILKLSYEAIPEDGRILIVDAVIENEEGIKRQVGLMSDVLMMAVTPGGIERTEYEFKSLFYKAGFKGYNVIQLPYYYELIEVSKK